MSEHKKVYKALSVTIWVKLRCQLFLSNRTSDSTLWTRTRLSLSLSLSPFLSPLPPLSLTHSVCFLLQFASVITFSLLSLSVRLSVCVYVSLSLSLITWCFLHSEHERHEIMYTTNLQDMFLVKSSNNSCPSCRRARYHEICRPESNQFEVTWNYLTKLGSIAKGLHIFSLSFCLFLTTIIMINQSRSVAKNGAKLFNLSLS